MLPLNSQNDERNQGYKTPFTDFRLAQFLRIGFREVYFGKPRSRIRPISAFLVHFIISS